MLSPTSTAESIAARPAQLQAVPRPASTRASYSHILVPTRLAEGEREAVRLALHLATPQFTRVTLLHVLPESAHGNSVHWLDAIDRLHHAVSGPCNGQPHPGDGRVVDLWRQSALKFFDDEILDNPAASDDLRVECRWGDVATEISRYAADARPDLVILTSTPKWSWLPGFSSRVQSVLRLAGSRIVVVRPNHTK